MEDLFQKDNIDSDLIIFSSQESETSIVTSLIKDAFRFKSKDETGESKKLILNQIIKYFGLLKDYKDDNIDSNVKKVIDQSIFQRCEKRKNNEDKKI